MLISKALIPEILKDWKSLTMLLRIMMQMTQMLHFYSLCYIEVFEDPEEIIHRQSIKKLNL